MKIKKICSFGGPLIKCKNCPKRYDSDYHCCPKCGFPNPEK